MTVRTFARPVTPWAPGPLAAVGATTVVAVTASWFPSHPSPVGGFLDAVINEWIIWFVVLYLALIGLVSIIEKLPWFLSSRDQRDGHRSA